MTIGPARETHHLTLVTTDSRCSPCSTCSTCSWCTCSLVPTGRGRVDDAPLVRRILGADHAISLEGVAPGTSPRPMLQPAFTRGEQRGSCRAPLPPRRRGRTRTQRVGHPAGQRLLRSPCWVAQAAASPGPERPCSSRCAGDRPQALLLRRRTRDSLKLSTLLEVAVLLLPSLAALLVGGSMIDHPPPRRSARRKTGAAACSSALHNTAAYSCQLLPPDPCSGAQARLAMHTCDAHRWRRRPERRAVSSAAPKLSWSDLPVPRSRSPLPDLRVARPAPAPRLFPTTRSFGKPSMESSSVQDAPAEPGSQEPVDAAEARRLAAAARRAKVLARGKDRLTQITTGARSSSLLLCLALGVGRSRSRGAASSPSTAGAPAAAQEQQQLQQQHPDEGQAEQQQQVALEPPAPRDAVPPPSAQPTAPSQSTNTPSAAAGTPSASPAPASRPHQPPPVRRGTDPDDDDADLPGDGLPDATAAAATTGGLFQAGSGTASAAPAGQGAGARLRQAVRATARVRCLLALSLALMLVSGQLERSGGGAALYQTAPPLAVLALTQASCVDVCAHPSPAASGQWSGGFPGSPYCGA